MSVARPILPCPRTNCLKGTPRRVGEEGLACTRFWGISKVAFRGVSTTVVHVDLWRPNMPESGDPRRGSNKRSYDRGQSCSIQCQARAWAPVRLEHWEASTCTVMPTASGPNKCAPKMQDAVVSHIVVRTFRLTVIRRIW